MRAAAADLSCLLACLLACLLGGGCGGPPPCARSSDCARDSVCGFDGRCGPLAPPSGARFAGSRWLHAADWGIAGADGPLGDAMPVGGPSGQEALLSFGPLPEGSQILRALLVLHAHPADPRRLEGSTLVVEHVEPFRGGALPARHSARPDTFAAGRSALAPGRARPVRIDLTEVTKRSAGRSDRTLYLLLRDEEAALTFASPFSVEPELRPRIELMIH